MKGIDRWIREVTQKRIVSLQVVVVLATVLWMVSGPIVPGEAQTPPNSITFDNQSGQNAHCKSSGIHDGGCKGAKCSEKDSACANGRILLLSAVWR